MISRRFRRSHRSARLAALVAAVGLFAAACSPPGDLEVALDTVHTDVVFGASADEPQLTPPPSTPAPPPPVAPPPPLGPDILPPPPAPLPPPLPTTTTEPPPPPDPCPQADFFDIPDPAPHEIDGAPKDGVYSFRQDGSAQIGAEKPVAIPTSTERTIRVLETSDDGTYRYEQVMEQLGATMTTVFRFIKPPDLAPGQVHDRAEGIYIESVTTEHPDGTVDQFAPVLPGLRIFPHPAEKGLIWESTAADPASATVMQLTGVVPSEGRVDACGEVFEGWISDVTIEVTTPDSNYHVEADYLFMPQMGGLITSDNVEVTGSHQGQDIVYKRQAYINSVTPVRPVDQGE